MDKRVNASIKPSSRTPSRSLTSGSGRDNGAAAAAAAVAVDLISCQLRYSIRDSTNTIIRPPSLSVPSQVEPSSACGYTNLSQISVQPLGSLSLSPLSLYSLPPSFPNSRYLTCRTLLGLIPENTLSSLQPFRNEPPEALSTIPRVLAACIQHLSLSSSLNRLSFSHPLLKSGLHDRRLSAKGKFTYVTSLSNFTLFVARWVNSA